MFEPLLRLVLGKAEKSLKKHCAFSYTGQIGFHRIENVFEYKDKLIN